MHLPPSFLFSSISSSSSSSSSVRSDSSELSWSLPVHGSRTNGHPIVARNKTTKNVHGRTDGLERYTHKVSVVLIVVGRISRPG